MIILNAISNLSLPEHVLSGPVHKPEFLANWSEFRNERAAKVAKYMRLRISRPKR